MSMIELDAVIRLENQEKSGEFLQSFKGQLDSRRASAMRVAMNCVHVHS